MPLALLRPRAILVLCALARCFLCAEDVAAHEGWGIVVDRQGQIYFSDIPTNTIWRLAPHGRLEAISTQHSHALALAPDGSIYGTDEHHTQAIGSVWRITPDGSFHIFRRLPPDLPLNLHPFIIDPAGNIYSTNSISFPDQRGQQILFKWTLDGQLIALAGGARGHRDGRGSDAQFANIDGMAWAADGSLYLTDGVYVRRVTMDGTVTTVGEGELTSESWGEDLMGLTVSPRGELFVADYSGRRIWQIAPDGNRRTVLETGWIWSPTGVSLVGEDLYVLEHLRMPLVLLGDVGIGAYARVRKVSPDGTVATLATVWGRNTRLTIVILLALIPLALLIGLWRQRRRRARATGPAQAS